MTRMRGQRPRFRGGFGGPMRMFGPPMGPMGPRFGPMMGPPMRPYGPRPVHPGMKMPMESEAMGRSLVTHQAFDMVLAKDVMGRATPVVDEEPLKEALLAHNQKLVPNSAETQAVQNLVGKVEIVMEKLLLNKDNLSIAIDEVRPVGSFKKGTMLAGHPVADLVVILKELPTSADIESLAEKVQEKLKEEDPSDDFPTQANEGGFNTTSNEGALVRVLVTTLPKKLIASEDSSHVDVKLLEGALATIRHARWFEENASHTTIKVLVRILKDMKKRFAGLAGMTPWLIDLLAFRSATLPGNIRDPLPINVAFKRSLQLIATGIFLPGSLGIVDPCESGQVRAHSVLSLEEQDVLCATAQTLLRTMSYGDLAISAILGEGEMNLDTDISSWGGVLVTPGAPAYDKEEHKKESLELEAKSDETKDTEAKDGEEKEKNGVVKMES